MPDDQEIQRLKNEIIALKDKMMELSKDIELLKRVLVQVRNQGQEHEVSVRRLNAKAFYKGS